LFLLLRRLRSAQTEQEKLEHCLDQIDKDAEVAYQYGLTWLSKGNRPPARQCTALALIALGQEAEGAHRLEELADAPDAGGIEERGVYLAQSGNAWLLAKMPDEAIVTLTNAMKLRPSDGELFKDRSRAHVMLKHWKEAASDLDNAIQLSAADAEAYRLRGYALMKQNRLAEAWNDVEAAQRFAEGCECAAAARRRTRGDAAAGRSKTLQGSAQWKSLARGLSGIDARPYGPTTHLSRPSRFTIAISDWMRLLRRPVAYWPLTFQRLGLGRTAARAAAWRGLRSFADTLKRSWAACSAP